MATTHSTVNVLKRIQNLAKFTEDEKAQLLVQGADGSLDALVMSFESDSPLLALALTRKLGSALEGNRPSSLPVPITSKGTVAQNPKLMSPPMKPEKQVPLPVPVTYPATRAPIPPPPTETMPKKSYVQLTKYYNAANPTTPSSPNGWRSPVQYQEVNMDPAVLADIEKFEQTRKAIPPVLQPTERAPQPEADDAPAYSVELANVLSVLGIPKLQPFQEETLGCLLTGDDIIVVRIQLLVSSCSH